MGDGGVGDGGVGEGPGPPPVSGQDAHQHTFPPLPHGLLSPSVVHLPPVPASDPSVQIEASSGSHLVQTYLSTDSTGAEVGGGVGAFVGLGVGGFVGTGVGAGVGAFVGTGVGGFVGLGVGGAVVGEGVGGNVVGAFEGGLVGLTGALVGGGVGALLGTGVGGFVGLGDGGGVVLHEPVKYFVSEPPNAPPEARVVPWYSTL